MDYFFIKFPPYLSKGFYTLLKAAYNKIKNQVLRFGVGAT